MMRGAPMGIIPLVAFAIRLFSVVKWESVMHNYDPYFNYRATKVLADQGMWMFFHWFDDRSWFPIGRMVGGTVYPGLMLSATLWYRAMHAVGFTMNIRNICVFLSPMFAALTTGVVYFLSLEVENKRFMAAFAAFLVGTIPSYISRSSAGSYDNEGVAIFAMMTTTLFWIRSLKYGSLLDSLATSIAFLYMALSWGGYVFIFNVIALHSFVLLFMGRFSDRLYTAFTTFHILSCMLVMQIPFVGFNLISQSEMKLPHIVFVILNVWMMVVKMKQIVPTGLNFQPKRGMPIFVLLAISLIAYSFSDSWSGRVWCLLDPTHAAKMLPIIASVSEHQPTPWCTIFMEYGPLLFFLPLGILECLEELSDSKICLLVYSFVAWYFSGIMVRLTLIAAPVACILSALAVSHVHERLCTWQFKISPGNTYDSNIDVIESTLSSLFEEPVCGGCHEPGSKKVKLMAQISFVAFSFLQLSHCVLVSSVAYSSITITIPKRVENESSMVIHDDIREAYFWLRSNTETDSSIMAWWDYGYQISSMANRTVLIDNNTWNNTHIATVGRAFASTENQALPIIESLGADYVMVMFGYVMTEDLFKYTLYSGKLGYPGDDLNKFVWISRIVQNEFPNLTMDPSYQNKLKGENFTSSTLESSLLYKLSYYRFAEVKADNKTGFDLVRQQSIPSDEIELKNFEECYTTSNWVVRIYKLKKGNY